MLPEIFIKICFWLTVWFGSQSQKTILYTSRVRMHRFSNRFLRWNREILPVVLSTMKATFWAGKKWQNLAIFLENGLKKPFCGKIWANGAKRVFIWVSVSPKEVESVEISHAPGSLLHSVISGNSQYNPWCYDTTRRDTTEAGHNLDRHNSDRT